MILHLNYTAREDIGPFKTKVVESIKNFIENVADLPDQPLMRLFSMRHEFPTEWHTFLHKENGEGKNILSYTLGRERFPFFTLDRDINVMKIEIFSRFTQDSNYTMNFEYNIKVKSNTQPQRVSTQKQNIALQKNTETYGGLYKATLNREDLKEELDITLPMRLTVELIPTLKKTRVYFCPPQ